EDQPLPADASPTALLPGYVADFDPEEDPKEDLEEDHADYPADGGDDDDEPSDDNEDDDDTDDEDEEPFEVEDDDEEEEHLAPANSYVVPIVDPVPSAGDTKAFETDESAPTPISPQTKVPFTQTRLCRARKTVRFEPPMSPSMEARITEYAAIPLPPLPPPPSSLHLPPHVPTSLPLPSSPLPPLQVSLFIPLPADHREDIPKVELPPRKRLCPTAPTSRYEVGESSTAAPRPTRGHRADYGFIGTTNAEISHRRVKEDGYGFRDVWVDPTKAVGEVASTTLEGVNARVTKLAAVQEQDTQDGQLSAALGQIQALQARGQTHADDREGAASTAVGLVFSFLVSDNHNNMSPRRTSATTARAAATAARAIVVVAAAPMTAVAVEQLIKARVYAALANHETLRNSTNGHGDGSHNSNTRIRGTVRTPRECTYKDFLNCKPLTFKGTEGVVMLSQWFEKMESVFHISNCAVENQVKFATCTFLGNALTWWNFHMKTVTQDVAYAMD
ncbi:hypothetical protein Tco_0143846, partial [Tanacetum coccineum]